MADSRHDTESRANIVLRQHFYDFDLKPDQLDVLNSVLCKKDTVAIFPTGFGKSVCYVLPPLLLDQDEPDCDHMSLVISPLKALIEDQIASLTTKHCVLAGKLYPEITADELEDIKSGNVSVIYATPELVVAKKWKKLLTAIQDKICLVAYDEAHCITEWGLDFRPEYKNVGLVQSILDCPVLALTATLTKEMKQDIDRLLGLTEPNVISIIPDRPNIFLAISKTTEKHEEELKWVLDSISSHGISCVKVLIYVNSIAACERLYIWLHSSLKDKAYNGQVSIDSRLIEMYHSNTDKSSKDRIMEQFCKQDSTIRVLIATIACGLGVDIPDVQIVVLWGIPSSLLQMWQEMGRCGRDGRDCLAICYAYPRSLSMPCEKCKHSKKNQCSCSSRKTIQNIVQSCPSECQRLQCLEYFYTEDSSKTDSLKSKGECTKKCTSVCQCRKCKCCIRCQEKCACPTKLKSINDVIEHYLHI